MGRLTRRACSTSTSESSQHVVMVMGGFCRKVTMELQNTIQCHMKKTLSTNLTTSRRFCGTNFGSGSNPPPPIPNAKTQCAEVERRKPPHCTQGTLTVSPDLNQKPGWFFLAQTQTAVLAGSRLVSSVVFWSKMPCDRTKP